MTKTNPNKVNQYIPDPRQALFLTYYLDPKSETFSNILQSGIKAGYSREYSENLSSIMPEWLSESIGSMNLLGKAERVLNKTLDYNAENKDGEIDTALLAIQNKSAQFIAGTIGKNKFSTKGEDGLDKLAQNITGIEIKVRK
jgi:hypothetical protein